MRRKLIAPAIGLVLVMSLVSLAAQLAAQAPPGAVQPSAEPSIEAKIAELKAAKTKLAREARETMGYHESLRQMKIVKIDQMIKRLENGENIPQRKIEHTIGHMGFPLYNPNG